MWVIIGWLLVFAFPLVVIYLSGGISQEPLLDDHEYERRKRNARLAAAAQQKKKEKKQEAEEKQAVVLETEQQAISKRSKKNKKKASVKKEAAVTAVEAPVVVVEKKVEEIKVNEPTKKKNKNKAVVAVQQPAKVVDSVPETKVVDLVPEAKAINSSPPEEQQREESTREIDEHMDPTVNYARVMRIKPEESDDEWESVPYEEGWSQVKSRRPHTVSTATMDVNAEINNTSTILNSNLDKKQRENLSRAQKKKETKAVADKLQQDRLRKHQKELEKIKIQEFYSSGKGKNTLWGKNGQKSSSKTPQSVASVNEFGQLIWE